MAISSSEYPAYFDTYISLINTETPIYEEMQRNFESSITFLQSISEDKKDHAYESGKWTIAEVVQHLIDVELVMAHRAFRISRNDAVDLPSFDHSAFAAVADVSNKSLSDLCAELIKVRAVTNIHFEHLKEDQLKKIGSVSGGPMSVRALGYILIGHIKHHEKILKERYL